MSVTNHAKPPLLRWGLGLLWVGIILGCAKLALSLAHSTAAVSPLYVIAPFLAIYVIMALLLIYVGMQVRWARIGLFVLYLLAVLPAVPLVISHFSQIPLAASLTIAQALIQGTGLFLVFRQALGRD